MKRKTEPKEEDSGFPEILYVKIDEENFDSYIADEKADELVDEWYGEIAVATYRLGQAYRLYLRFDHPWATVLTSQVLFVLSVVTALALFSPRASTSSTRA